MTTSRDKYIKLVATAGLGLLILNTQLIKTQSPANSSPEVTVGRAQSPLLQDLVELDMKERRDLLGTVCSRYGRRLKVPLKSYNKKLRYQWSIYLIKSIRILSRFDLKHHLMYCENYKELLLHFSLMFPEGDSKSMWYIDSNDWLTWKQQLPDRLQHLGHSSPQDEQDSNL